MTALEHRITQKLRRLDYPAWRAKVEASGGCARPIHLTGHSELHTTTGNVLHRHSGQIMIRCGNRRATVCEPCSRRYATNAFHLLRAGLSGGHKDLPPLTDRPRAFLTLTAPSFGPVHTRRVSTRSRVIPCGCGEHHHKDDPRIGTPTDPNTYDYIGAVLWQAHAGQLWARFTTALRRALAHHLGIPGRLFSNHARLSYAKVAEYQRRGLVHFHAAIRLDGPDGPAEQPPQLADSALLRQAILDAAHSVTLTVIRPDGTEQRLAWGVQLDIREITATAAGHIEDDTGQISEARLAGYIAKYATKSTGTTEATDRPIRSELHITHLQLSPHHERIIRTIWELGSLPRYEQLNLRKWAHMLGFRGHFLTKSQRYSTTFTALKTEQRTHRITQLLTELGHQDQADTVAVVGHWALAGIGHHDDAEQELAIAIAARAESTTRLEATSWIPPHH
jgi:hypothetical protein